MCDNLITNLYVFFLIKNLIYSNYIRVIDKKNTFTYFFKNNSVAYISYEIWWYSVWMKVFKNFYKSIIVVYVCYMKQNKLKYINVSCFFIYIYW